MIIIRLEHHQTKFSNRDAEGNCHINQGCYMTDIAYTAFDKVAQRKGLRANSSDNRHRTPCADGISDDFGQRTVCAFKDWAQFRRWFPFDEGLSDVQSIARLALYHIDEHWVRFGDCQVTAHHGHMHLIKVLHTTATQEQVEDVYSSHFIGDHSCLTQ